MQFLSIYRIEHFIYYNFICLIYTSGEKEAKNEMRKKCVANINKLKEGRGERKAKSSTECMECVYEE